MSKITTKNRRYWNKNAGANTESFQIESRLVNFLKRINVIQLNSIFIMKEIENLYSSQIKILQNEVL